MTRELAAISADPNMTGGNTLLVAPPSMAVAPALYRNVG